MTEVKTDRRLMTGNQVVVEAALANGADYFAGYPITPTTEVLSDWAKKAVKDRKLGFLQTEDETSAGMAVLGAILAGKKAWTASAGMGHVLLQDPMSLAESLRLPIVLYVGQRGGPSTGTVIYSQQELNMARIGGNGEGLRFVYAPGNIQELYEVTQKAFNAAWKYRFPTIILGDGYLSKTLAEVDLSKKIPAEKATPYFLNGPIKNMRNCYSQEIELVNHLDFLFREFGSASKEIIESESFKTNDAKILICAWGTVGYAAKVAVANLRKKGVRVGLFRPITMRPLDAVNLIKAAQNVKEIILAESSVGQFGRMVRETLAQETNARFHRMYKPAEGITTEQIESMVMEVENG